MHSSSNDILLLQQIFNEKQNLILENEFSLSADDIYKELQIIGYNYSGEFRGLKKLETGDFKHYHGINGWTGNMVTFLDTFMQSTIFSEPFRKLLVPVMIKQMRIDPKVLLKAIAQNRHGENVDDCTEGQSVQLFGDEKLQIQNQSQLKSIKDKYCLYESELPFYYDSILNLLVAQGFEMERLITSTIARKVETKGLILDSYEFVSNDDNNAIEEYDKTHINEYLQVF